MKVPGRVAGSRAPAVPTPAPPGFGRVLASQDVADRRRRLRRLDDCLDALEQAHECNLSVVSEPLALLVGDRVPSVRVGMLIADAIEEVLREQEPFMVQMKPESGQRRVRRRREPFDIRLLLQRR